MPETIWLARDADGYANLYTLLTVRPVLRSDGMATTEDPSAECLGAFPADVIEPLLDVRLAPGECIAGTLAFKAERPAEAMPHPGAKESWPSSSS